MEFFDIDLHSGDPVVREWFLVKSKFWPLALCGAYALVGKYIGIWLMKDRRPFNLRILMLIYNAFVVVSYTYLVTKTLYYLPQVDRKLLCSQSDIEGEIPFKLVTYGWLCYLLKYVEFLDTVFFILRKKNHLLTNLHIIHHSVIPLLGWLLLRTERSGYQAFPVILNAIVHILMYTYYGLAAFGPEIKKYLWWKKYLTMIQMAQFILIASFIVIFTPLSGCSTVKSTAFLITILVVLFFGLFYNYFYQSFIKKSKTSDSKAEKGQFMMIFMFGAITPLTGCFTVKIFVHLNPILTVFFFVLFYNYYYHSFVKKNKEGKDQPSVKKAVIQESGGFKKRFKILENQEEKFVY